MHIAQEKTCIRANAGKGGARGACRRQGKACRLQVEPKAGKGPKEKIKIKVYC